MRGEQLVHHLPAAPSRCRRSPNLLILHSKLELDSAAEDGWRDRRDAPCSRRVRHALWLCGREWALKAIGAASLHRRCVRLVSHRLRQALRPCHKWGQSLITSRGCENGVSSETTMAHLNCTVWQPVSLWHVQYNRRRYSTDTPRMAHPV